MSDLETYTLYDDSMSKYTLYVRHGDIYPNRKYNRWNKLQVILKMI
jgi:hypothetical protein